MRGCSLGSDEPSIALRPGLRHGNVSENNGVRGVGVVDEIGDQTIIAKNEPERAGAGEAEGVVSG